MCDYYKNKYLSLCKIEVMETKRYSKLTKAEISACRAICAVAPLYDVVIDFDRFPSDSVYTRKVAAIMIAHIANDLRDTALVLVPDGHGFAAGFGTLSWYIKKISVLL